MASSVEGMNGGRGRLPKERGDCPDGFAMALPYRGGRGRENFGTPNIGALCTVAGTTVLGIHSGDTKTSFGMHAGCTKPFFEIHRTQKEKLLADMQYTGTSTSQQKKNDVADAGTGLRKKIRLRNFGTKTEIAPLCDIPSGCCSFTGPWTVTCSSLRMLRRVATFCQPLRPVLLLVSFPRSRSPVVGVLGLC